MRIRRIAVSLAIVLALVLVGFLIVSSLRQSVSAQAEKAVITQEAELAEIKAQATTGAAGTAVAGAATQEAVSSAETSVAGTQVANEAAATADAATREADQATRMAEQATATAVAEERVSAQVTATAAAIDLANAQAEVRRLARTRPLRSGASLSGDSSQAMTGSLTSFVEDEEGVVYLLSLAQVLAGDSVLQPGLLDNSIPISDVVGSTTQLTAGSSALARLDPGLSFDITLPGLGPVQGVRQPVDGAQATIFGRGSGVVQGALVKNPNEANTYLVEGVYAAGDEGALVANNNAFVVGMVVGNENDSAVVAPIQPILDELEVHLIHIGDDLFTLNLPLPAESLAMSSSGLLAAGGREIANGLTFPIRLWNNQSLAEDQEPLVILGSHNNWVTDLAFSPDGNLLASGSLDDTVRVWATDQLDAIPDEPLQILRSHDNDVLALAFSPDGQQLASGDTEGRIFLHDASNFAARPRQLIGPTTFDGQRAPVNDIAYYPDPEIPLLLSGGADKVARLWYLGNDGAYRDLVELPTDHLLEITALAISPDGSLLATASSDRTVRVWNLASYLDGTTSRPVLVNVLGGHSQGVSDVSFSADGRFLATGSEDNLVRLWNVANFEMQPVIMEGHAGNVTAIAFSPDSRSVASSGRDRTVRIWSTQTLFEN